jgi:hypothetical protein
MMADGNQPTHGGREPERATEGDAKDQPVYRKPKLQRHDQIEQVRPYGPSEI